MITKDVKRKQTMGRYAFYDCDDCLKSKTPKATSQ
jgi:hypothetical protein